jgi:hypothetical protein
LSGWTGRWEWGEKFEPRDCGLFNSNRCPAVDRFISDYFDFNCPSSRNETQYDIELIVKEFRHALKKGYIVDPSANEFQRHSTLGISKWGKEHPILITPEIRAADGELP